MIEFILNICVVLLAWRLYEVDKIMKNYDRNMIEMFNEIRRFEGEIGIILTNLEETNRKVDHCLEMCNEILKEMR